MESLMDMSKIKLPKGINTRDLYPGEDKYFRENPNVSGMATDDDKVILNPYSGLKPEEYQAVAINESARVLMRQPQYTPDFDLTESQISFLDTTTYRNAPEQDRKATIAARLLSGDPSAGAPTAQQSVFVKTLRQKLIGE
jgi:hypothetical protein